MQSQVLAMDPADIRRIMLPAKPITGFAKPTYVGTLEPGIYKLNCSAAFRFADGRKSVMSIADYKVLPDELQEYVVVTARGLSFVADVSSDTEVWLMRIVRVCA